jgi:hydrogenase/urease accessory protein HupE
MMRRSLYLSLILAAFATNMHAHEMRPAYLQLHQTGSETYDVFWKVPAAGDNMRLSLYVEFPERCANATQPRALFSNGAYTEQWSVNCPGGLSGSAIRINGLSATLTDVLVRIERTDNSSQVTRLTSASPSFIVEAAPRRFEVARTYLLLGIEHILTGVDHLLFISGLLLLVSGVRNLLVTVSAFTLSHTVTLSLATLGFVHVPPAPVEAVIALSILFVAYEVLRKKENPEGLAQRKPWLVAFSFGLLHGLGFAGGLSAAGLPAGHIPLALGFFSGGVEIGHFSFVAIALLVIATPDQWTKKLPEWSWRFPPYAIGSIAAYWLIARLASF